jgi:hypothetical protein
MVIRGLGVLRRAIEGAGTMATSLLTGRRAAARRSRINIDLLR